MDFVNDLLTQIMKNTTFEIKINIPMIPENTPTVNSFSKILTPTSTTPSTSSSTPSASTLTTTSSTSSSTTTPSTSSSTVKPKNEFLNTLIQACLKEVKNDDIDVLINQAEDGIATLIKILTNLKQQMSNNQFEMLDKYIEMLNDVGKILKSFKIIRSSLINQNK